MPRKKVDIVCINCGSTHYASSLKVKYCSTACYNTNTKTKGIDGYKPCEVCGVGMPYRNSLKVRDCGKIRSVNARFCSNKCKLYWRSILENPTKNPLVIKKISEYRKKNPPKHLWTKDAKLKQAKTISGVGHWNWQGGITPENKRRRNLAEYRDWRIAVFERDDYTCQICKARNGNGKSVYLQADHIKPWSTHHSLRLDISNGRTLCVDCHRKTETYGVKAKYL